MGHPPRIPIWLPVDREVIYFVTFCVLNREPVLADPETLAALRSCVARLRGWRVYAAVLMPDHLHLLAAPSDRDAAVGNLSGALKRWLRQELKARWRWQPGCFDHLLRSQESAQAKWEYMRENPVRADLVQDWRDWPYTIGFAAPADSSPKL
ncbi:transposase [bacterium]|nr:transposase [bacterium]